MLHGRLGNAWLPEMSCDKQGLMQQHLWVVAQSWRPASRAPGDLLRSHASCRCADETAFLLVVLEVHGSDIQPFGYDDRVDFLVALDNAIVHINLSNIELLAVEEFLPAAGPAAESLLNLYGTNGIIGKPPLKPQAEAPSENAAAQTLSANPAGPPQTRAAGRKLLQIPGRGSFTGACDPGPCPSFMSWVWRKASSCRSCTFLQLLSTTCRDCLVCSSRLAI